MKFVTLDSLTLVLAYVAYYSPNFLPGRCLAASHLGELSRQIGQPDQTVRSARAHPLLAVHLALGHAAGLLAVAEGYWRTTLATLPWLEAERQTQLAQLQQALVDGQRWAESVSALSLQDVLTVDFLAYIGQQFSRQQRSPEPVAATAVWLPEAGGAEWRLALPENVAPYLLFHLWQMGQVAEDGTWRATPYAIARAAQRGYSLTLMESVLIGLTGEPLGDKRQNELVAWYGRHDAYRIRPAYLLSVKQPEQLDEVMGQQRWRRHIGERLSPRHALVTPGLTPLLQRQLKAAGYPLQAPFLPPDGNGEEQAVDAAACWLALEVLHKLGKIIPLPFAVSAEAHYRLKAQLSLPQQAELGLKAEQVVEGVKQAIRGRDAYFLPERAADPALVAAIETAIAQEGIIEIAYQALGEPAPRLRRVEPHWLERREAGAYLHGYCYLAEANRVFRLDRVHSWQPHDGAC